MKQQPYDTEAALCADFITWAHREGGRFCRGKQCPKWTAYAETAGWDILLVAADGTQIGVQAKLRFNLKVIEQSIPDQWEHWRDVGPDYRAVLVPTHDSTATKICAALGLKLFAGRGWRDSEHWRAEFTPGLDFEDSSGWHYWSPRKRHELPEFVPDVVAGASGPSQLTKWKVGALRIVAVLELRGHVTRADFKQHGVDPRRWTGPSGWLQPGAAPGQFVRGTALDFDRQHPTVFAQVLEEQRAAMAGRQAA